MLLGLLGVSPSGCPEPFWVPCALLGSLYQIQNVTFLHIYMLLGLLGEPFWVPCALLGSLSLFLVFVDAVFQLVCFWPC